MTENTPEINFKKKEYIKNTKTEMSNINAHR